MVNKGTLSAKPDAMYLLGNFMILKKRTVPNITAYGYARIKG